MELISDFVSAVGSNLLESVNVAFRRTVFACQWIMLNVVNYGITLITFCDYGIIESYKTLVNLLKFDKT